MLAPSENATSFRCVTTCNHTSKDLTGKFYKFCQIYSPVNTSPLSNNTTHPSLFIFQTFIVSSLLFLIIILNIACIYYCCKKKKKRYINVNEESPPLIATDDRNLNSIAMSSLDWENKRLIGEGKFGYVYRCYYSDRNMDVAVKELVSTEKSAHTRFLQEMGIISGLRHPHVTQIIGFNYTSNLRIITYLRKHDLATYLITMENPKTETLIRFCKDISDAMIYLHSIEITHGDLKASNILVKDGFTIEVADIGLAGIVGNGNRVIGTLTHIPLEYLNGTVSHPTKEGDVWSFGVTAWEIFTLCKKRPYAEFSITSQIKLIEFLKSGKRLRKPDCIHDDSFLWDSIIKCNIL